MFSSQLCSVILSSKFRHHCMISLSLKAHIRHRNTHLTSVAYDTVTDKSQDTKRDVLESRPIRTVTILLHRVYTRSKHHSRLPDLNNHYSRPSKRYRVSMLELRRQLRRIRQLQRRRGSTLHHHRLPREHSFAHEPRHFHDHHLSYDDGDRRQQLPGLSGRVRSLRRQW